MPLGRVHGSTAPWEKRRGLPPEVSVSKRTLLCHQLEEVAWWL